MIFSRPWPRRWRRRISGSTTTNSSPPRRASVSPSRSSRAPAWRPRFSSSSPNAWPSVSLTSLKRSRSSSSRPTRVCWRRRLGDRLGQAVEQQLAVGQLGQRVVVEQGLEALLGTLALDGVAHGAHQRAAVGMGAHEIVLGAGAERLDRGFLVVVVGDDDDGRIVEQLVDGLDRLGAGRGAAVERQDHRVVAGILGRAHRVGEMGDAVDRARRGAAVGQHRLDAAPIVGPAAHQQHGERASPTRTSRRRSWRSGPAPVSGTSIVDICLAMRPARPPAGSKSRAGSGPVTRRMLRPAA